jgi:putative flavoprotein involved in K+ transport
VNNSFDPERVETVIIGGGQAGLAVAYQLAKRGLSFVILDAHQRVGDAWRTRWDSLRLFTPARYDGLPGMRFPAPKSYYPTKDEMADYLESYALKLGLPVRTGVRVDALARNGQQFLVAAGDLRFEADNVVIATSSVLIPRIPSFASELDPFVIQRHSFHYVNTSQLQPGPVLIVGAGNSGADIAMDVVKDHPTLLSGRDVGHIPFKLNDFTGTFIDPIFRFMFHRVMTVRNPIGRKARALLEEGHGLPLERVKPKELAAAGVERVARVAGVKDGHPVLEDGRVLDVANVIWCTGYRPDYSWIDLPNFERQDVPAHYRGVVDSQPDLYFIGLIFQYSVSSGQINGLGRDSAYIAKAIATRMADRTESARVRV